MKTRLYLYAKRKIINAVAVTFMITVLAYLFVNFFVFERVIFGKAQGDKLSKKYDSAIIFYNLAYPYYKINHFSKQNKEIYLKIPYELSMCYLNKNDKKEALANIYLGLRSTKKEYGLFSHESATFIRKYLIQYYLINGETKLAEKEFSSLLQIYKKIGYSRAEIADIARIKGDIYYQKKDYTAAMKFYKRAYKASHLEADTDYEIFSRIINKICSYEIARGKTDEAILIYRKALTILKDSGERQSELSADMLISLGDIYRENDLSIKNAVICYEKAIEIIKQLPYVSYLRQNLPTYLATLRDLYNKSNQQEKVKNIDAEILKMQRFSLFF